MDDMIWIGKKVYVQIINSTRRYSGVVEIEEKNFITIRDIKGMLVEIPRAAALIQEER